MTARDSDAAKSAGTRSARQAPGAGLLERQFAALAEGLPRFVWLSMDGGHWTWSCPRWTSYTGLSARDSVDLGWYAAVHPDDRAAVEAAWQAAPARGVLDMEHRLLAHDGGEVRRFRVHGTPLPEAPGRVREWFGTCTEVADMEAHEAASGVASDVSLGTVLGARRNRSSSELHRRICDVLSLARLVARRASKAGPDAEEFAQHFEGRLDAIARAELAVARDSGVGVDLEGLIAEELLAHAAVPGERVSVCGPTVSLRAEAAGLLGLALHELAANAVKYGALSAPEGHLDVTWRVRGGVLRLNWQETGVPLAHASAPRGGFGTELIERTLARELDASGSLDVGPDGARCIIALPLDTTVRTDALPTEAPGARG